uniref:Uncharacterized protein n=1 Tax=Nelumbo nucifera TaxID=4432 RepID=A0A822ZFQ5_NELNU|nr:TPA_asm: hypothetical protein HUJ06_001570 [Nelumbo nucifera]
MLFLIHLCLITSISAAMAIAGEPEVKPFNRWSLDDVQVGDISLVE